MRLLNIATILSLVMITVLFAVGIAQAADLSHNADSTLTLTGDVSYDSVRVGYQGGTANTVVDAEGTSSFTSSGSQFYVGVNAGSGTGIGTVKLGSLNNITATQLTVGGAQPDNNNNTGNCGLLSTLAGGVTTINAGNMAVGTGKSNGTAISGQTGGRFLLGAGATLTLYGQTGNGSRAGLVVGRWSAFNSHSGNGTLNLSGGGTGLANLYLNELAVAKVTSNSGGSGNACTGNITLSSATNRLDVSGVGNVVKVAYNNQSGGNTINATATLTIGNLSALSSVTSTDNSTAILIGYLGGSPHTSTGTMNLNGGMLTITTTGSAIAGGGGTSRLNLKDCTLKAGASSTNWITGLTSARLTNSVAINTAGYDIAVPQGFSSTGSLVKDGEGVLTLTGVNTYTGGTTVSNGTLLVDGSVTGSVTVVSGAGFGGTGYAGGNVVLQSGAKAVLTPDLPLTIPGSVTLNNNVIHLRLPEGLDIGVYTLLTYNPSGSSGSFASALVIDTGSANGLLGLVQSAGQVDLKVFAGGTVYKFR